MSDAGYHELGANAWLRVVPRLERPVIGLEVTAVGAFSTKSATTAVKNRELDAYALVYVHRGDGWFEAEGVPRTRVRPGTLLCLFPGCLHSYAPSSTWAEQWAIFDGPWAREFERARLLCRERPVLSVGAEGRVRELMAELVRRGRSSAALAPLLASSTLYELLTHAYVLDAETTETVVVRDPLVVRACQLLKVRLLDPPAPEQLAQELQVPYSTLRRRFRRATGRSMKEYARTLRLTKARELLAATDLTIDQVAVETGYNDPSYLARSFKKREGLPPSEWRRRKARG